MQAITIQDFEDWRAVARALIANATRPSEVQLFEDDGQQALFADDPALRQAPTARSSFSVPSRFLSLAESVGCHRAAGRWDLLFRTLWRIKNENKNLLEIETDDDVLQLTRMEKQVRRDAHKMKAFVRFRKVVQDDQEFFVAWHQPDHRIVRRVAPFFSRRFSGMNWTILTPDECVTWNQESLEYGSGVPRSQTPQSDELEELWRTYYASIFNPARVKIKMMKSEMPVRYWKNLPETDLIPDLLAGAPRRVAKMIEQHEGFDKTADDFIKRFPNQVMTLSALKEMAAGCTACHLHCDATQTVFGAGPANARIVLLGEQPGDQEDLSGEPFVGPAGQVLEDAIRIAGLDRAKLYVTNIVKHFKHTQISSPETSRPPRGKKRLHQKPNAREVRACRPWFDAEWSCLKEAEVLICLGVTSAKAVFGPGIKLTDQRGRVCISDYCQQTFVTWHPSAILRASNTAARESKMRELIEDLELAKGYV